MFANLKYLPKKYKPVYIGYMICLLVTYLILALVRPSIPFIAVVFIAFFIVDAWLLTRSQKKIWLPLLVDLFIYSCWFIVLLPFR